MDREDVIVHLSRAKRQLIDGFIYKLIRPDVAKDAVELLQAQPQIVRCKDCKKRYGGQCPYTSSGDPYIDQDTEDDWFCAEGETKDK